MTDAFVHSDDVVAGQSIPPSSSFAAIGASRGAITYEDASDEDLIKAYEDAMSLGEREDELSNDAKTILIVSPFSSNFCHPSYRHRTREPGGC